MDINERFALWEKKYKPHGEHEELLYIIAKDAVAALSSPHPEAREEDWIRDAFSQIATGGIKGEPNNYRDTVAVMRDIAKGALSRLAAQKDEGQVVDVTALRLLYNMAACSPAPKEQREEIIRNHMAEYGYTVIDTDAPRGDHILDVTNMVVGDLKPQRLATDPRKPRIIGTTKHGDIVYDEISDAALRESDGRKGE